MMTWEAKTRLSGTLPYRIREILGCAICLLFTTGTITAFGQAIVGTILDGESGKAIPHAEVYFSGTTVGTSADSQGRFELDITRYGSRPLTVSAIGYVSGSVQDLSEGRSYVIYLLPMVYELGEVEIRTRALTRERKANLYLFREEFLGSSGNARQCEIANEEVISFNYDSDDDTLKAWAVESLKIHNRALGYDITYYLDKFEHHRKAGATFFTGNILFREDSVTPLRFTERKRRLAFAGSRMQFMRLLWADDLPSGSFVLRSVSDEPLGYDDLVSEDEGGRKFMERPEGLYLYRFGTVSKITFLRERVYFDGDGFFDPEAVDWWGELSRRRIGDMLPYEYELPD